MLDARDTSSLPSGAELDYPNVGINHWDNPKLEAFAPASTTSHSAAADDIPNGSCSESLSSGQAGLRSRKGGLHRRASTVDGSLPSHPLASPISANNNSTPDGAATRSSLRHWMRNGEDYGNTPPESLAEDIGDSHEGLNGSDTMVIVHEVLRTDSLAGVALKYGIALADLRKVNQLWASDTIHLRKVLYIPLQLSSKKHLYHDFNNISSNGVECLESAASTQHSQAVIQRVPASQLAFFPPPSQPLQPYHNSAEGWPGTYVSPEVRPTMSGSQVLSSFIQSLPLPARDTILARLSLDSSESSSTANASDTSSDQEHEMDVLGASRRRDCTPTGTRFFTSNDEPMLSTKTKNVPMNLSQPILLPVPVPLQTEQLKPSPMMELPISLRRLGG